MLRSVLRFAFCSSRFVSFSRFTPFFVFRHSSPRFVSWSNPFHSVLFFCLVLRFVLAGALIGEQESAERALGTPGWEEVAVRNGVTVWKKYFPKVRRTCYY